mmetsp:Transcript_45374/g.106538  ORF Transcript_45374/g.106538 Transcript_45374/m.106538 type:complete len:232 (+) Transcript_45374:421-1116(+)
MAPRGQSGHAAERHRHGWCGETGSRAVQVRSARAVAARRKRHRACRTGAHREHSAVLRRAQGSGRGQQPDWGPGRNGSCGNNPALLEAAVAEPVEQHDRVRGRDGAGTRAAEVRAARVARPARQPDRRRGRGQPRLQLAGHVRAHRAAPRPQLHLCRRRRASGGVGARMRGAGRARAPRKPCRHRGRRFARLRAAAVPGSHRARPRGQQDRGGGSRAARLCPPAVQQPLPP